MPLGRVQGRKCGECQFCCSALAINDPDLYKDGGTPCRHQYASGYGIYHRRWIVVTSSACGWWVSAAKMTAPIGLVARRR
jgi:hypothetical protein